MKTFSALLIQIYLSLLFEMSAGERRALDPNILIKGSKFIFTGEVHEFENITEMIHDRPAKIAKVWIYEVLKGDIQPSFVEPRRHVGILVIDRPGKDASIVLQKHHTYLFFANRNHLEGEIYNLYSRTHEAVRMHFKETQSLISYAKRIKHLKNLIEKSKN